MIKEAIEKGIDPDVYLEENAPPDETDDGDEDVFGALETFEEVDIKLAGATGGGPKSRITKSCINQDFLDQMHQHEKMR